LSLATKLGRQALLPGLLISYAIGLFALPFYGWISGKVGRRAVSPRRRIRNRMSRLKVRSLRQQLLVGNCHGQCAHPFRL
jgi:hypothetical protein